MINNNKKINKNHIYYQHHAHARVKPIHLLERDRLAVVLFELNAEMASRNNKPYWNGWPAIVDFHNFFYYLGFVCCCSLITLLIVMVIFGHRLPWSNSLVTTNSLPLQFMNTCVLRWCNLLGFPNMILRFWCLLALAMADAWIVADFSRW